MTIRCTNNALTTRNLTAFTSDLLFLPSGQQFELSRNRLICLVWWKAVNFTKNAYNNFYMVQD